MGRRLLIAFFMMLVVIYFVMAADSFEPLSVEFTVDATVYAGFTGSKVVSTIEPEDKINEVYFTYSSDDKSFVISNMYYYVQTFTAGNIIITLSGTPLQQNPGTASATDINWQSISEDTSRLSSQSSFVYEENQDTNIFPRVYSGEIFIRIPIKDVKDTSKPYTATLTLEVTSK